MSTCFIVYSSRLFHTSIRLRYINEQDKKVKKFAQEQLERLTNNSKN